MDQYRDVRRVPQVALPRLGPRYDVSLLEGAARGQRRQLAGGQHAVPDLVDKRQLAVPRPSTVFIFSIIGFPKEACPRLRELTPSTVATSRNLGRVFL